MPRAPESIPSQVDIAIVTILQEEYDAVKRRLKNVRRDPGTKDQPNQYAWVVGEIDAANGGTYQVALALTLHPGNTSGSMGTGKTVARWRPRYVLLVGIAGGLPREQLGLGDVVVSKQIVSYEYGKIEHNAFNPRPDFVYQVDGSLLRGASSLSEADWRNGLGRRPSADRVKPKLRVGTVGSGEKVIDDRSADFFAAVEKAFPKLLAVEMEGAGAAAAIQEARDEGRAVGFLMIRGISDMPPDTKIRAKNPAARKRKDAVSDRDHWKSYAANAAASFAVCLISQAWPLPPGDAGHRDKAVPLESAGSAPISTPRGVCEQPGHDPETATPLTRPPELHSAPVDDVARGEPRNPVSHRAHPAPEPPPQRLPIPQPGGALPLSASIYVARAADREIRATLRHRGAVCAVVGPRQVGKSSLLTRVIHEYRELGGEISFLDMSGLDIHEPSQLYRGAANIIASDLGTDLSRFDKIGTQISVKFAFAKFLSDDVKKGSLLVFDELDHLFTIPGGAEFLGVIRAVHGRMATTHEQDIRFLLSTVSPLWMYDFDRHRSPFNIGFECYLSNFAVNECRLLFDKAQYNISDDDLGALYAATAGQPYLMHMSAFLMAGGTQASDIISRSAAPDGPFAGHLHDLSASVQQLGLGQALLSLANGAPIADDEYMRLVSLGVVKPSDTYANLRTQRHFSCGIYQSYFSHGGAGLGRLVRRAQ